MKTNLLVIVILMLAACSKSPTKVDAGPEDAGPFADLSAANFCDRYAEAACGSYERCQGSALSHSECLGLFAGSAQVCPRDLLTSGQLGLDRPKAAACLEALVGGCDGESLYQQQEACRGPLWVPLVTVGRACVADHVCIPSGNAPTGCFRGVTDRPASCGGVCSSGQPLGAACSQRAGAQCATGWCSQGTCVAYTAAGQTCAAGTCPPDSFCDTSGATPLCVARVTFGQACTGDVCAVGLHCGLGTCRSSSGAGESCDVADRQGCNTGLACYGGHCRAGEFLHGDVCDPSSSACSDSICTRVADGGAVCLAIPGLGEPCTTECARSLQCENGVCVPPGSAGEACPRSNCKLGLKCNGTCQVIPRLGESCTLAGPTCLGSNCDEATKKCTAYEPPLGPCTDEQQCWPGYDGNFCHLPGDGGAGFCATCDLTY